MSFDDLTSYIPSDEDIQDIAASFYKTFVDGRQTIIDAAQRDRASLAEKIKTHWGTALDMFVLALNVSSVIASRFTEEYIEQAQRTDDNVFIALRGIHSRAELTASEIGALLRSGHAAGALARWRTLHELACTAMFIMKYGQDTAIRYLDHAVVEQYEDAMELERLVVALGYKPPTASQKRGLQSRRDAMIAKYGSPFAGHYGWAVFALDDKKPTFSKIEVASGISHMRFHYGLASRTIHAKPYGLTYNPASADDFQGIITSSSAFGLSEPAIRTLRSLEQCNITFVKCRSVNPSPSIEEWTRVAALMAQRQMVEETCSAFADAEKAIRQGDGASGGDE